MKALRVPTSEGKHPRAPNRLNHQKVSTVSITESMRMDMSVTFKDHMICFLDIPFTLSKEV